MIKRIGINIFTIICVLLISSCSDDSNKELQSYIYKIEAGAKAKPIEPLPRIIPYKPFYYKGDSKHSPFTVPAIAQAKVDAQEQSIRLPDFKRQKGPLEKYPLNKLKLVGVVYQKGHHWGLVLSGDGRTVYTVKVNDHIGSNHGVIIDINKTKLILTELIKTPVGTWKEKSKELKLTTDDKL